MATEVPNWFDPQTNSRAFRDALGSFATGVTLVTTTTANGPTGIVANSFASVSLDPALVLWSPAKASRRYADFVNAKTFAIHVMSESQKDICNAFSKDKHAFEQSDWGFSDENVPLVSGALAVFECSLHAIHDAGDHTIIVGAVDRCHQSVGAPLLFHAGQYGELG